MLYFTRRQEEELVFRRIFNFGYDCKTVLEIECWSKLYWKSSLYLFRCISHHSLTQESDLLGLTLRASLSSGQWGTLVGNVEGGRKAKSGYLFLHFSLSGFTVDWLLPSTENHSSCHVVLSAQWFSASLTHDWTPFPHLKAWGWQLPCYYWLWGTALFLTVSLHLGCNCVNSSFMKLSPTYHDMCGYAIYFPSVLWLIHLSK